MHVDALMTLLAAALVGYAAGALLTRVRLAAPPASAMRTNYRGREVPAVLGGPMTIAGMTALACVALAAAAGWRPARIGETGSAAALVIALMAIAGAIDDRRGDERDRGFKGHLSALRSGRVTGGILKILAGGLAGGLAGLLVFDDTSSALACALLVPLAANAINLFDRAPGRAGKVTLLVAVVLMVLGSLAWAIAVAGLMGALVAALIWDLSERGMLGDAGANPLGAALGLGLALSLGTSGRWVAVGVLVVLNAASERVSFSKVIEGTGWLRSLDELGRK